MDFVSTKTRVRGAYDFLSYYEDLCILQDSVPLTSVKCNLNNKIIDVNADRIRASDWLPILHAIKVNKSLKLLAFRSSYADSASSIKRKIPACHTREIATRICRSLKACLVTSNKLTTLELSGLSFRSRDIVSLSKGLNESRSIRHLSLENCPIRDEGVFVLCRAVKNSVILAVLILSGCCISSRGAEVLAKVIKHQSTKRHSEAWKGSLRYRLPNLDSMGGLRRVTLNDNVMIGDDGALCFADALKDDLWLKALDLQNCGITTKGGTVLLDILTKFNTSIEVLDVRRNPLIDPSTVSRIIGQVQLNCDDASEFQWLALPPPVPTNEKPTCISEPASGVKARQRRSRSVETRRLPAWYPSGIYKRSRAVSCNALNRKSTDREHADSSVPQKKILLKPKFQHVPWRTALRANRLAGFPPDLSPDILQKVSADRQRSPIRPSRVTKSDSTDSGTGADFSDLGRMNDIDAEFKQIELRAGAVEAEFLTNSRLKSLPDLTLENVAASNRQRMLSSPPAFSPQTSPNVQSKQIKQLLIELRLVTEELKQEREARREADKRILSLMEETRRLTSELSEAKQTPAYKLSAVAAKGHSLPQPAQVLDENLLVQIDTTFRKFTVLVDVLRRVGLDSVLSACGLENANPPILNLSQANGELTGTSGQGDFESHKVSPSQGDYSSAQTNSYAQPLVDCSDIVYGSYYQPNSTQNPDLSYLEFDPTFSDLRHKSHVTANSEIERLFQLHKVDDEQGPSSEVLGKIVVERSRQIREGVSSHGHSSAALQNYLTAQRNAAKLNQRAAKFVAESPTSDYRMQQERLKGDNRSVMFLDSQLLQPKSKPAAVDRRKLTELKEAIGSEIKTNLQQPKQPAEPPLLRTRDSEVYFDSLEFPNEAENQTKQTVIPSEPMEFVDDTREPVGISPDLPRYQPVGLESPSLSAVSSGSADELSVSHDQENSVPYSVNESDRLATDDNDSPPVPARRSVTPAQRSDSKKKDRPAAVSNMYSDESFEVPATDDTITEIDDVADSVKLSD